MHYTEPPLTLAGVIMALIIFFMFWRAQVLAQRGDKEDK